MRRGVVQAGNSVRTSLPGMGGATATQRLPLPRADEPCCTASVQPEISREEAMEDAEERSIPGPAQETRHPANNHYQ